MTRRVVQFFFFAIVSFFASPLARCDALVIGQKYALHFTDIDGRPLSTGDGQTTIVVLATTANWAKARATGDRVPEYCLGNPNYRMITVVRFTGRHTAIARRIAIAFVRRRVNEEARQLQRRYEARKIRRDARRDIWVVTDFEGAAAAQLGNLTDFLVLVFAPDGKLLAQWSDVPDASQLAAALK